MPSPRAWPPVVWLWATLTTFLAAGTLSATPTFGLDPSWVLGINLAAAQSREFGADLVFTYGPWGFLDRPLILDRGQFVGGLAFSVFAVSAVWYVVFLAVVRRTRRPHRTAAGVSVAVVLGAAGAESSLLVVLASAGYLALRHTDLDPQERTHGRDVVVAVGFGALAGLMLQVKFSTGVAMVALALLAGTLPLRRRQVPWPLLAATLAGSTSFLACWTWQGQSLSDLPEWLLGSFHVAAGYGEAMAVARTDQSMSWIVLALVVAASAWSLWSIRRRDGVRRAVVVALPVGLGLVFAFKAGFTRHDAHELGFFLVASTLLIVLFGVSGRRSAALVAAVAFAMTVQGFSALDPALARERWRTHIEAVLDQEYRTGALESARAAMQQNYAFPPELTRTLEGRPVTVDPVEIGVAWAYRLDWQPLPVPQNYSAYTEALDEMNADAIEEAAPDHLVLRGSLTIDGRNAHWDSPRYVVALACHYRLVTEWTAWRLLDHTEPRCSESRPAGAQDVESGEPVSVPDAGADELVVASFLPEKESLVRRLANAALIDHEFLYVRVASPGDAVAPAGGVADADIEGGVGDDPVMRLPQALAGGPLLVRMPDVRDPAVAPFGYDTLTFNQDGRVEFRVITVDR